MCFFSSKMTKVLEVLLCIVHASIRVIWFYNDYPFKLNIFKKCFISSLAVLQSFAVLQIFAVLQSFHYNFRIKLFISFINCSICSLIRLYQQQQTFWDIALKDYIVARKFSWISTFQGILVPKLTLGQRALHLAHFKHSVLLEMGQKLSFSNVYLFKSKASWTKLHHTFNIHLFSFSNILLIWNNSHISAHTAFFKHILVWDNYSNSYQCQFSSMVRTYAIQKDLLKG